MAGDSTNRAKRRSTTSASLAGLAIQCAALLLPAGAVLRSTGPPRPSPATVTSLTIVAASVALLVRSFRALGLQWSLVARVRPEHVLVTGGPYGRVRHPIYLATAGLLAGILLAAGDPWTGVPATALYVTGTVLRGRSEEVVLREAFGTRFDAYARAVPAWLPRFRKR